MRKLLLLAALALPLLLAAQAPSNDNCSGLIDLGKAPACPGTVFSNLNATATDIGAFNAPACLSGGAPVRDVWFAFTCPESPLDFRITLTAAGAQPIKNPQLMLYRGNCTANGLALLRCAEDKTNSGSASFDIEGLSGGLQYYLRVSDYAPAGNPPNWGDFTLCVAPIPPIVTIDQGGSQLCEGTLYDSGGPLGDYSFNEDFTFKICPDAPSACITFTLEYYNLETAPFFGTGDYLSFFDGPNTNSPPIAVLGGADFEGGGGGVCYAVQATSGCLTLRFTSDDMSEYEGWKGSWTCSPQPCVVPETLSVDDDITSQEIENVLNTPFTVVNVTSIKCPKGGYGTFQFATDDNALGFGKGLLLTSGRAQNAIGPNNQEDAQTKHNAPGDADLDFLSGVNGPKSADACVVELDVIATSDELTFEYVFGSEEYPEFVNDAYNDIFAFLISGPGIVGDPGLGGAKNIALIPGTQQPVQINSVNALNNWPYFRPNPEDAPALQYDGLTSDSLGKKKSLTARATVIPCQTYHLKLAIADRFDDEYDSGVFISEIKGGSPAIATAFEGNLPYLVEGCSGPGQQITFTLPDPLPLPIRYYVNLSGTAEHDLDYTTTLPDSIIFQPGQTSLTFTLTQLTDNLTESTETIVIALSNNFGCGPVVLDTLEVELRDQIDVKIAGSDTLHVCLGQTVQVEASGASEYFWSPPGAVSDPFIANPSLTPTQSFLLKVEGKVGACTDTDSVWVNVIDPKIEVSALADTAICLGTAVSLLAANNTGNAGLVWSPAAGLDNPNSPTPLATPTKTTTYTASVTFAGCTVSDAVTILVDTLFFPKLASDTTICQNYPVQLATVLQSSTEYEWVPSIGLSDPTSSGPIALPDQTTTYTLTATSANGYCTQLGVVKITVRPADVDIAGPDSLEICLGTAVPLTATATPAGATQVAWSPTFYTNPDLGPSTTATPDESVTIFATYQVNGCTVRDSVHIRVDSLPESKIALQPTKAIYCPGDTVILVSKTYEPANFPDIEHEWQPFGGQETDRDLWNMVITATMTHTFVRITKNHACSVTDSVMVPVGVIPQITITATPNDICPGELVQLNATVVPDQKLKWQPDPLLSCTECPNPTVAPSVTTTFQVTTPDAECPGGGSVTVNVTQPPLLQLNPNPFFCLGDSILLNNVPIQPNVTYVWTASVGLAPIGANPIVSPAVPTTYTITATGKCVNVGTITVTPLSATLNAGTDQSICFGETATLTAAITGSLGGIVRWQPGDIVGNTITVTPDQTTTYTATYTYGPDCQALDAVTVSVNPAQLLLEVPPSQTLCIGESISLNTAPAEPGVVYIWTSSAGPVPISPNPIVTPGVTTSYTVTAQSGDCSKTAETTISVASATVNAGPDQTICFGQTATLTATSSGTVSPNDVFTWLPSNFKGSTFNVSPPQTTTYTVTLDYGPGCISTDAVTVTVNPTVALTAITGNPKPGEGICEGTPVKLKVAVLPVGTPLVWAENGTPISGATADSVTVKPVGDGVKVLYTVTGTSAAGCSTSVSIEYPVRRCFEVPNAFTPNGDMVNGTFGIVQFGGEVAVEYFAIYNRWGQKVFESRNAEQRWDGRFDDKDAPADVYGYVMQVRFPNGEREELKGDVTLLR